MRVALALLLGTLATSPAAAAARHDADVAKDVRKAVLSSVYYGVFDSVAFEVKDGHVTVGGSVWRDLTKEDVEKRIARVDGVRSVTTKIALQSGSLYDDRLRRQLYRAIYGGDTLLPHAALYAPVRILVDRGRVTLTGFVGSRVEQVKVGMVARETAAFGVDNRVQLEADRHAEAGPTI